MITTLGPFIGVNKDLSSGTLPLGAATGALNIRFREGYAEICLGQQDAYGPAPIAPISAFACQIGTVRYWIVLSQAKAYCVTGIPAVWTNITRQTASVDTDYAAELNTLWNGGVLNGVPFFNNGVDSPQMWAPVAITQRLQGLTAWPASTTCRVMRPFSNYLFAFDVTVSGNRFPHRVKWSSAAQPGTVPAAWVAAPSNDAGEFDLSGSGYCIDAMPMRGNLIIYKENSTHIATYTGGNNVFSFQELFSDVGMLAPDCGVSINGKHYVLTSNDVIVHAGGEPTSVIDKATRRTLFKSIDPDQLQKCFLTKNVYFNEVWVCYPKLGSASCDTALVFNYKDGTISFRDLPLVTSASTGLVEENVGKTWDTDTQQWNDDTTAWDENEFGAQLERTMLSSPSRLALVIVDSTALSFTANVQAYIERIGIDMSNPNMFKTTTRLRPRFLGPTGSTVLFRAGGHKQLNGSIEWQPTVPFVIGVDESVDVFSTGRFLAWRLDSTTTSNWRLENMDIEFEVGGEY